MCRHTAPAATLAALGAAAALAGAVACSDRPPATAPATPGVANPAIVAAPGPAAAPPERLARALALALADPGFRSDLKARLDASPHREHKLWFQQFLAAEHGRARDAVARHAGRTSADVAREADSTIALEMYLPVPAHRRAWTGGANVLVATAIGDHDVPVAFDTHGRRMLLDPKTPPATPVIALVPVETDFTTSPSGLVACLVTCDGGGSIGGTTTPPPAPGLYMTQSHFVDDFEGWLKGSPEFEVHILGQKGQSDSLTDYQCAGEHQPAPYYFDQNNLDWSGQVMLFSRTQIDQYNATHPGQNVRVFVVEDDDTACQIKNDPNRLANLLKAIDGSYQALTAGNDSTNPLGKYWKRANAIQKLWAAIASFINTNDELVGTAIQDAVAGEYHPGFNWIVKGENNVTNGWIRLELR
jgi:hypothetical protein